MTNKVTGSCHCGNLGYELSTEVPVSQIRARACDCSFCRIHAAQNWSDARGSATIRVADERQLGKYRFGLRTADFFVCRVCGSYLGAVFADEDGVWSTVNLRLSDLVVDSEAVSYSGEDAPQRIARRKRVWMPTTIRIGG